MQCFMQMYKLILGLTLQNGLIILFLQRNIGNNNRNENHPSYCAAFHAAFA